MKYCVHCGNQVHDDAVVCVSCGRSLEQPKPPVKDDTGEILQIVVKVFMILGCVASGWLLIPLAWTIPMTISVFKSFREKRPVSIGMKVCTLLFVNLIAGVCLLCMNDGENY